jgi:hypothetical protein
MSYEMVRARGEDRNAFHTVILRASAAGEGACKKSEETRSYKAKYSSKNQGDASLHISLLLKLWNLIPEKTFLGSDFLIICEGNRSHLFLVEVCHGVSVGNKMLTMESKKCFVKFEPDFPTKTSIKRWLGKKEE